MSRDLVLRQPRMRASVGNAARHHRGRPVERHDGFALMALISHALTVFEAVPLKPVDWSVASMVRRAGNALDRFTRPHRQHRCRVDETVRRRSPARYGCASSIRPRVRVEPDAAAAVDLSSAWVG